MTGTFAGIRLADAPAFIIAQLLGAFSAALLFRWLPHLPMAIGVPMCMLVFALFALAFGIIRRSDVSLLKALARPRISGPAAAPDPRVR